MAKRARKRSEHQPHIRARYLTLCICFLSICLAFSVVLLVFGIRGTKLSREEGYVRSYTVPGVRGEIYDVNGKKLVGNSTSYDLVYEYGAMPDSRREINLSLLSALELLDETGNGDRLSEDRFVLEGLYPKLSFVSALSDRESEEYKQYKKFLERHEMTEANTDAADVVDYFTDRYKLSETLYTDRQITDLIRLYYEMERADFGAYASYTIASDVNMTLITAIEETNIEGVVFKLQTERVYYYPGIASHILGRVGKITAETKDYYLAKGYDLNAAVGISGVESAFEEWLHGQDGVRVIRYDKFGSMVESYYELEPMSGKDLYLTIDIDLQIAAEEGLRESIESIGGAEGGAITVQNPNSGAVLAMASYPTYDLSRFDSVSYVEALSVNGKNPWLNRAIQGVYAPGSTYKVGMALAGLETNNLREDTTYVCNRVFPHYHNPTCLGTHGVTDVVGALRDSCNVFFYYLGEAMGIESATAYTRRLGLGVPTGIELGERIGTVAGPESRNGWGVGDDISAAIGQSDHGYTPLQLSVYLSSVVNGGKRYEAHLLDSVRTFYDKNVIKVYEPTVAETVSFSKETYDTILEGMRQVVAESSTLRTTFGNVPVTVGGKTGTAQVDGKADYALFCGFAPLTSPEIVASCVIEEGVSGARAASPVARVMEKYFEKKLSSPDEE